MNSKAIKRQLLAAIAMVLVAALALGSSTYAWFVASGSVTATGMSVNVQSEGGLVIRYTGGDQSDAWGVIATAGMDTPPLPPTSTDAKMLKWATGEAKSSAAYDMNESSYKSVTELVYPTATGVFTENPYVVMKEFEIRSSNPSQECDGLYVKQVDVSASFTLNTALRVGIKYTIPSSSGGDPTTGQFIMAPVIVTASDGSKTTPTYAYQFVNVTNNENGTSTIGNKENVTAVTVEKANTQIVADSAKVSSDLNKAVKVQIFIWFEGQDEHLYSDNILGQENMDISVIFSSNTIENA